MITKNSIITIREKTAIVYKDKSYSYSELLQHVALYAKKLLQYKPKKVLIYAENTPEWIITFYAILKIDAIVVPIDVMSSSSELSVILEDCKPELIFTSEENKEKIAKALALVPELKLEVLTSKDFIGDISQFKAEEITIKNQEQTALIIYTSGTTSKPKGVMLSYKNIMFNYKAVCIDIPIITEQRQSIVILPLHHVFPLLGSMAGPLWIGQTIYITEKLSGESILATLKKGKINIIVGVPGLYDMFARSILEKINASVVTKSLYFIASKLKSKLFSKLIFKKVHNTFGGHIDYLVCGGAAVSDATSKVFKTLGFEMLPGYGMTETAPMISFTRPGKWHIGYAGFLMDDIELKIDTSANLEVAESKKYPPIGEICVRGDNVMSGYYNMPEETAEVIKDGWLHTGDMGFVDKRGLKITGRLKELIVTPNGKNIVPDEIESKFMKNSDFIKEIGVFMKDNIIQAVIVPDVKNIREQSIDKMNHIIKQLISDFNKTVAPYKRIKRFYITSKELPRNRLSKLQRFKLAEHVKDNVTNKKEETIIEGEVTEVYIALKNYIEKITKIKVKEHDDFEIDLAMDSLNRVSILAFIESKYQILLNETNLSELNTLRKLSDAINSELLIRSTKPETETTAKSKIETLSWKEIIATSKEQNFDLPYSRTTNRFMNMLSRLLFLIFFRIKRKGKENLPETPCIIVANHKSMIDPLLVSTSMKIKTYQRTYFYAKFKHFKRNIMKFLAKRNNVILMDINNDVRMSIQKLAYVLSQGKNIMIFPEGTRSKDMLFPFKSTFAILSKELNIPVVQVVIKGAGDAFGIRSKLPKIGHKISIEFLPQIFPKDFESYKTMTDFVQHNIETKIKSV